MAQLAKYEVLPEIQKRSSRWLRTFKFFGALHWTLGGIGVFAGALASGYPDWSPILGAVAAAIFGVYGFVRPDKQRGAYANAWRVLSTAQMRFAIGEINESQLISAVAQGEAIISENIFDPPQGTK